MEKGTSTINILTDKHTAKEPLGMPVYRWENNFRMYLKEIGISTRNWVDLTQENPRECDIEPSGSISHGIC